MTSTAPRHLLDDGSAAFGSMRAPALRSPTLAASIGCCALLLAACGGGGGGGSAPPPASNAPPPAATLVSTTTLTVPSSAAPAPGGTPAPTPAPTVCNQTLAAQKNWLRNFVTDTYLWYRNSPDPDPAPYTTLASYLDARLWKPTDRYSFMLSEQQYFQIFVTSQEYGHGAEWQRDAQGRIRARWIEPGSPAAQASMARGDEITALNGTAIGSLTSAQVNALLFPSAVGVPLTLTLRATGASSTRNVTLSSTLVATQPVLQASVLNFSDGRKVGYVVFNSFVTAATAQLRSVFAQLRQQGISDLVLDLRYNGGGFVSIANELGSMIGGSAVNGRTFVKYAHNDKLAASWDSTDVFQGSPAGTSVELNRVYVLSTGSTASASEMIINSLKPFMTVVQIGTTSYGKPVGQYVYNNCAQYFFVVNFETVNALNQGGYYSGITPTCTVPDNLDFQLGASNEPMLAAALTHRATGQCPAGTATAAVGDKTLLEQAAAAEPLAPQRQFKPMIR